MIWTKTEDRQPTEPGYYLTYYFNTDENCFLYKCIYWSDIKNEWCRWRASLGEIRVHGYIKETRRKYYGECVAAITEYPPYPKETSCS